MNKSGIYKITNIITGYFYIGSTNNFNRRKLNHLHLLRNNKHHSIYLQNSFNKHLETNFKIELIEQCDIENLIKLEQYYIDLLKPKYNTVKIAGSTKGIKCSNETKLKISNANKGKTRTQEVKQKLKNNWNGKYNNAKKVYLYDSNKNLLKIWNSGSDASLDYNVHRNTINKLARIPKVITSNKSKLKGFILSFNPLINNTNE